MSKDLNGSKSIRQFIVGSEHLTDDARTNGLDNAKPTGNNITRVQELEVATFFHDPLHTMSLGSIVVTPDTSTKLLSAAEFAEPLRTCPSKTSAAAATVSNLTVSTWPCGQGVGSLDASIGRLTTYVSRHILQRNS